jgi:hypothetical protein
MLEGHERPFPMIRIPTPCPAAGLARHRPTWTGRQPPNLLRLQWIGWSALIAVSSANAAWIELFDGQSLEGWTQRGDQARFEVREGCIVGHAVPNSPNAFLCTREEYSDFKLELEFQIDDGLNSGIQIRSQSRPEFQDGRVHGYQVEIDPSDRAWTGGIYDEGGAGWIQDLNQRPEARKAFRHGAWNQLRILVRGPRIQTWLNGISAADVRVEPRAAGFIGLQVHSVGSDPHPYSVRWRKIRVLPLASGQPGQSPGRQHRCRMSIRAFRE